MLEDDLQTEALVPIAGVSYILRFAELSTGMVRRIVKWLAWTRRFFPFTNSHSRNLAALPYVMVDPSSPAVSLDRHQENDDASTRHITLFEFDNGRLQNRPDYVLHMVSYIYVRTYLHEDYVLFSE